MWWCGWQELDTSLSSFKIHKNKIISKAGIFWQQYTLQDMWFKCLGCWFFIQTILIAPAVLPSLSSSLLDHSCSLPWWALALECSFWHWPPKHRWTWQPAFWFRSSGYWVPWSSSWILLCRFSFIEAMTCSNFSLSMRIWFASSSIRVLIVVRCFLDLSWLVSPFDYVFLGLSILKFVSTLSAVRFRQSARECGLYFGARWALQQEYPFS